MLAAAPQLENAFLNLCINARDAMPDGRVRMDYLTGTVFPAIDATHQDVPVRCAALRDATTSYQRDVSAYVTR